MLDKDLPSQLISLLQQKGNIGLPLSINETIAIYEEGQLRFKYKIPPDMRIWERVRMVILNINSTVIY